LYCTCELVDQDVARFAEEEGALGAAQAQRIKALDADPAGAFELTTIVGGAIASTASSAAAALGGGSDRQFYRGTLQSSSQDTATTASMEAEEAGFLLEEGKLP
jgi:hypothetical protein